MDFKDDKTRLLFFRYALPCSTTLVKRGFLSKKVVNKLIENLSLNKEIQKDFEKNFKIANWMCNKIARRLKKKYIDNTVIRKYFLFEHDKVVDWRYSMFKDFNPENCRVYSGKVIRFKNKKALIKTILGIRNYKTNFVNNLKIGDYVVVHRNFVVEKINSKLSKKLWKLKNRYLKSNKI